MEFILIALLIIAVVAVVAHPLVFARRGKIYRDSNALDALTAQREAAYDALRDLDFDYQLGKLSQSDYAALREKYKTRAALILQQIDATGNGADADAQIEEQIAQMRRAKSDVIETEIARRRAAKSIAKQDDIETEIARRRAAKSKLLCANCGTPYRVGDQFCAKCGNPLPIPNSK
ncbi:MAG: zinc ribbon domain-containing protein [Chloroflexi bacterium]|nr:zinc ribbon domain-containing protein [Chloroflexota bacterium]